MRLVTPPDDVPSLFPLSQRTEATDILGIAIRLRRKLREHLERQRTPLADHDSADILLDALDSFCADLDGQEI